MTKSQNYRIHNRTIKRLRKFEKGRNLKPNISETINYLLIVAEARMEEIKKL